jgi:hypothetical protein
LSFDPLGELVDGHEHMRESPGACWSGPTRSSPDTAKGQVMGMVWSACAERWVCLA